MKYQIYVDNQRVNNPIPLFFIDPLTVETLWENTERHLWGTCRASEYLIPGSVTAPNDHVFVMITKIQKYYFKAARVSIDTNKYGYVLRFNEGRHRTRWLLDSGVKHIPLGISKRCIDIVKALGLYHTLTIPGTELDLPITIKGHIELSNQQLTLWQI